MTLLYVGQMYPDTKVGPHYCYVRYRAFESIKDIKHRLMYKLAKEGKEWASELLDKIDGGGPFNTQNGVFLITWSEE